MEVGAAALGSRARASTKTSAKNRGQESRQEDCFPSGDKDEERGSQAVPSTLQGREEAATDIVRAAKSPAAQPFLL